MARTRHPQHGRALLMLLLANLFWGLSFPTIKAITLLDGRLLPGAGTTFVTMYTVAPRFVLAALLMLVLLGRRLWTLSRREVQQGMIIGLFAGAGMLLQNDGLQFTAASTSAFLTQMYAVIIPVWVALRARHNPGWLVWTCCALVLLGAAILGHFNPFAGSGSGGLHFGRGEWETLLSSVFFTGQILWLENPRFAGNRPECLTFAIFVTEGVLFSVLALATAPSVAALTVPWTSGPWLGLTMLLTVLCTIGAFSLMNTWQPKITATEAGLIYCVEPIFGSAMALFLPAWYSAWSGIAYANEHVTWALLVGGGLITLANLLIQLRPPERAPTAAS